VELRERGRGKGNDRASVISHNTRCEGRGYKMCISVENCVGGGRDKGVREVMEGLN
jgi:hypothetical protein